MTRRILLLATVAALMALMVALSAGVAYAKHQVNDPNCSFEQGTTTCTYILSTQITHSTEPCTDGSGRLGIRFVDTTTTTYNQIVYYGVSDVVKSSGTFQIPQVTRTPCLVL
jgi:hypothetical protein